LIHVAVVDIPQLRTLTLRVPAMVFVAEGIDALCDSRLSIVTTSAAKGGIRIIMIESLL
jgi:hypothetical protein